MELKETAWVAGIIEGEGTFFLDKRGFSKIKVAMTDLDVLERLQEWTGCGNITGPVLRGKYKPIYSWTVTSLDEFLVVAEAVEPWLLLRRYQQLRAPVAAARERKRKQVERRSAPGYRDRRKGVRVA